MVKKVLGARSSESKRRRGLCVVPHCRRTAGKKKIRCDRHHAEIWNTRNPLRKSYLNKKADAKRKGREFTITFTQWEQMAREGGLLERRGRSSSSMSVDRIHNDLGYTPENSRVITVGENSSKKDRPYLGPHWKYLSDDEKE